MISTQGGEGFREPLEEFVIEFGDGSLSCRRCRRHQHLVLDSGELHEKTLLDSSGIDSLESGNVDSQRAVLDLDVDAGVLGCGCLLAQLRHDAPHEALGHALELLRKVGNGAQELDAHQLGGDHRFVFHESNVLCDEEEGRGERLKIGAYHAACLEGVHLTEQRIFGGLVAFFEGLHFDLDLFYLGDDHALSSVRRRIHVRLGLESLDLALQVGDFGPVGLDALVLIPDLAPLGEAEALEGGHETEVVSDERRGVDNNFLVVNHENLAGRNAAAG